MKAKFQNGGLLLFILIFLILLSPVFLFQFFITVDGPAHLYNATIIREMLTGDQSLYNMFFEFNQQLVPNWTGHLIMMLGGFLLPAWMTEKLVILVVLMALPYVIYKILKAGNGSINGSLFLILPFTYTLIFYLGFYNYLIGVSLMLWMIHKVTLRKLQVTKTFFWEMMLGSLLLYFTHLLPLVLFLIFTGTYLLFHYRKIANPVKTLSTFVLAFLPAVILVFHFMSSRGKEGFQGTMNILPFSQLVEWLIMGQPFIGLNGDFEQPGIYLLVVTIFVTLIFTFIQWYKSNINPDSVIWLIMAGITFVCYFVVPDGMASGGFISLRLLLLFYLLLVIFILMNQRKAWMNVVLGVVGIISSFYAFTYRYEVTGEQSKYACELIEAGSALPQRSVVLPLNYSGNWLHANISNYVGTIPGIVVLDNYEAKLQEFPLVWKQNGVVDSLGNFGQSLNPSITIEKYERITGLKVTAISRFNYKENRGDSIAIETENKILEEFRLLKKVGQTEIFIRK
jgi:hypothetical protein